MSKNKFVSNLGAIIATTAVFTPLLAFAQPVGGNIIALLGLIEQVVGRLIPIVVALALIYFIWGLIQFLIAADSEGRDDGKSKMWWGIIALFVIVSIWGIVAFIGNILGINQTTNITPPKVGNL